MDDIRSITEDLVAATVDYYCPLKLQMTDEEYGDWYEVDNGYGIANEDAIRERLRAEQNRDLNDMAAYFHGSESARQSFFPLFGMWKRSAENCSVSFIQNSLALSPQKKNRSGSTS